jgi:hypothetical protein
MKLLKVYLSLLWANFPRWLHLQPHEIIPFWLGLAGLILTALLAFALNALALNMAL